MVCVLVPLEERITANQYKVIKHFYHDGSSMSHPYPPLAPKHPLRNIFWKNSVLPASAVPETMLFVLNW